MCCQLRDPGVTGVEWLHLNLEVMCTTRTCGSRRSSVWGNPGTSHLRTSGVCPEFPAASPIYKWHKMFTFPPQMAFPLLSQCCMASVWFTSRVPPPPPQLAHCWVLIHPQEGRPVVLYDRKGGHGQIFLKANQFSPISNNSTNVPCSSLIRGMHSRLIWGHSAKVLCLCLSLK